MSGADHSSYPPTPGTPVEYTFSGLIFGYSLDDMRGTDITARDARVMVSRPVVDADGAETEPSNGDRMRIGGNDYSVVSVRAVSPGGYSILWSCQCRAGD